VTGEDPRKTGLKNGLRQLTTEQLWRVLNYKGEMVLDTFNYHEGNFCPLAVGIGLDLVLNDSSHDEVFQILTDLGYKVYNTRGIEGEFYTENRKDDLREAAREVILERVEKPSASVYHLTDDTGGGSAFCGNCNYSFGYNNHDLPEDCPKCQYKVQPSTVGLSPYPFGGSDF